MCTNNSFLKYEEEIMQRSQSTKRKKNLPQTDKSAELKTTLQETLNRLFPPITVNVDGKLKTYRVSSKEVTVFEIFDLRQALDEKMKQLKEEHVGFCPEIHEIHNQLLEELIRQEVIICPERGLLLKDAQEESLKTLKSLRQGCLSSFAYGICKDLLSRKSVITKKREIFQILHRIKEAEEYVQNRRNEWMAKIRKTEEEEELKRIERSFMENQLKEANQKMVEELENRVDTEHRWLKDTESDDSKKES